MPETRERDCGASHPSDGELHPLRQAAAPRRRTPRPAAGEVNRQLNASWRAYTQSPSLLRRIAELEAPALFVYGGEDIRPSWPTEQLAELLPLGRFRRIEGAAHLVWGSHADELRAHLRAFTRELVAGGW